MASPKPLAGAAGYVLRRVGPGDFASLDCIVDEANAQIVEEAAADARARSSPVTTNFCLGPLFAAAAKDERTWRVFAAYSKGDSDPVAFCVHRLEHGNGGYALSQIAVLKAHQRKGVGAGLVAHFFLDAGRALYQSGEVRGFSISECTPAFAELMVGTGMALWVLPKPANWREHASLFIWPNRFVVEFSVVIETNRNPEDMMRLKMAVEARQRTDPTASLPSQRPMTRMVALMGHYGIKDWRWPNWVRPV